MHSTFKIAWSWHKFVKTRSCRIYVLSLQNNSCLTVSVNFMKNTTIGFPFIFKLYFFLKIDLHLWLSKCWIPTCWSLEGNVWFFSPLFLLFYFFPSVLYGAWDWWELMRMGRFTFLMKLTSLCSKFVCFPWFYRPIQWSKLSYSSQFHALNLSFSYDL